HPGRRRSPGPAMQTAQRRTDGIRGPVPKSPSQGPDAAWCLPPRSYPLVGPAVDGSGARVAFKRRMGRSNAYQEIEATRIARVTAIVARTNFVAGASGWLACAATCRFTA